MSLVRRLSTVVALVAAICLTGVIAPPADAQNVLRVVMHSDLTIVDPIWTTVLAVNRLGDGLRGLLDPRIRKQI